MHYLIDGYNLLFAMGVLQGRTGPHGLEKARGRLLGLLHGSFGEDAAALTVVFDAAQAPPGAAEVQDFHGIEVHFALRQAQADDLIELMIQKESAPARLAVVSDDHRLQQAARRRHCQVQGCGEFLDLLARRRRQRHAPPRPPDKPEAVSGAETQHWLDEFAGLEQEPGWKELFDPLGMDEET